MSGHGRGSEIGALAGLAARAGALASVVGARKFGRPMQLSGLMADAAAVTGLDGWALTVVAGLASASELLAVLLEAGRTGEVTDAMVTLGVA